MQQPAFVQAIASDGRSYSKELMDKTTHILRTRLLGSTSKVEAFQTLMAAVESTRQHVLDEEAGLGDIPDQYLG